MTNDILIRTECGSDRASIREVNLLAFGRPTEADLVDSLRVTCGDSLSLVATEGKKVVGHILFIPVSLEGAARSGMGLGPMAVLSHRQQQGIGSMLVCEGLRRLTFAGCPFVIVLGHPGFYPRFGFVPASRHGIHCSWPGIPDEAFMILALNEHTLKDLHGIARFRLEFDAAV